MKPNRNRFLVSFILTMTVAAGAASAATWTGETSGSWAEAGNWTGTPPDGTTEQAIVYDNTSMANLTQMLDGAFIVTGITVAEPAETVSIASGTSGSLTIGSSGIDLSAATQNLTFASGAANSFVSFAGNQDWNVASGRTLGFTFSGNNRTLDLGDNTISKTGDGALVFNPGSSLSNGVIDIQAGTVSVTSGSSISSTSAASVSYKVETGATLALAQNTGTLTFNSPIELNGGMVTIGGGAGHTIGGAISGTGGTIRAALSSTGTVTKTVSANFSGDGTYNLQNQITNGSNHRLNLTGDNSGFSGIFNINGTTGNRTVRIGFASAGSASATWNIESANTLLVESSPVQLGDVNINNAGTVNLAAGSQITIASGKTFAVGPSTVGTSARTLNVAGTVNNEGSLFAGRYSVVNLNSGATWYQSGDFEVAGSGGYGASFNINAGATFYHTGEETIKLNPGNNLAGSGILTVNGGTLLASAAFQSTVAATGGSNGIFVLQNGGVLWLFSDVLDLTADPAEDGTAKVLFQLGAGGGVIETDGYDTEISQNITGAGSLTKTGQGTLTLSGNNTYSGDTSVEVGGVLEIKQEDSLHDQAAVRLDTGGTLRLSHSSTDVVDLLYIDGIVQAPGTWGGLTSSATHKTELIEGDGILDVTRTITGFAGWAEDNELSGDPTDDADGDGLSDGLEYALADLDPNASDGSPGTFENNVLSFSKRAEAVANGDVTYIIEVSEDLGVTDPWTPVIPDLNDDETISATLPETLSGRNFARLRVEID